LLSPPGKVWLAGLTGAASPPCLRLGGVARRESHRRSASAGCSDAAALASAAVAAAVAGGWGCLGAGCGELQWRD